ncbi:MAG: hypothetical protein GY811_31070 [Myxococcales bacterium]|nr:hypothetical protein [Myxococcales bacterium]
MSPFDTLTSEGDEFLHRRLCPDGTCVGILDSDDRCKECGMVDSEATTDPRLSGLKREEDATPHSNSPPALADVAVVDDDESAALDEQPGDFENRRLCPDGACIGVVGLDGTCSECGAVA